MKITSYIDTVKSGREKHSQYPALFTAIHYGGYLSAIRDLAAEDEDISVYDFDNLLDYIGTVRYELRKELDNDELA